MRISFLKKIFFLIFLWGVGTMPVSVLAVDVNSQLDAAGLSEGAGYELPVEDPRLIVAYGIRLALSFLGILFLAYTLYAGFIIMTARGEEEKVTEGRKTLIRATMGLVLILSAYSITLLAEKIATGDAKHQGDYIEIKDTDLDYQDTDQRHDVDRVGCPFGLKMQPDGSCGEYEND